VVSSSVSAFPRGPTPLRRSRTLNRTRCGSSHLRRQYRLSKKSSNPRPQFVFHIYQPFRKINRKPAIPMEPTMQNLNRNLHLNSSPVAASVLQVLHSTAGKGCVPSPEDSVSTVYCAGTWEKPSRRPKILLLPQDSRLGSQSERPNSAARSMNCSAWPTRNSAGWPQA
jgi:hypothetical protein